MKKRKIMWIGMAIIILVFGVVLTSCDDEPEQYDYEYYFNNQSSYTIQVTIGQEFNISPRSFTLSPGKDRTVGSNTNYNSGFSFSYSRTDGNGQIGIRWDINSSTFFNSVQ